MKTSTGEVDHLHKKHFAKMVNALVRHLGIRDIALAEDIVQDTFAAALQQWKNLVPENPEAWLYRTCRNIALKHLRDHRQLNPIDDNHTFDESFSEIERIDSALAIILSCAHPRFSPRQQVILALRYAVGLRVAEIATVMATLPETITKMLQRIRAIINEEKIQLQPRLDAVSAQTQEFLLKTIYLMFNEGYKSSQSKSILNLELCEEAIIMMQFVINDDRLRNEQSHALYSLMLFNLARFEARFEADGSLIDLENQDRSRWDHEMIQVGTMHLLKSKARVLSAYHLEATITFLHCNSPSFADTEWKKIVSLYEQLQKIKESDFVQLNLAIAHFYAGHDTEARLVMESIGRNFFINHYYLYHVAYGKMLLKWNQMQQAKKHFSQGLNLAPHQAEKKYIQKLILEN